LADKQTRSSVIAQFWEVFLQEHKLTLPHFCLLFLLYASEGFDRAIDTWSQSGDMNGPEGV